MEKRLVERVTEMVADKRAFEELKCMDLLLAGNATPAIPLHITTPIGMLTLEAVLTLRSDDEGAEYIEVAGVKTKKQ